MHHHKVRQLVSTLLEDLPVAAAEQADPAYDIYQRALDEHPEWWADWSQKDGGDPGDTAEAIFDKLCAAYQLEPDSELANGVYEHIMGGLT